MLDSQQTQILPDELRTSVPSLGAILRDRYRLDSELGRGGMGTVYRATDLELQREVAVKVLSGSSQTSEGRERLIRVFAFDEAIAAYGRARDCAEGLGLVAEQLEQEESMGLVYMLHGETIRAGEHFERALALAADQPTRVRLQCQAAASLVTTGDKRGLEYLREALQGLDPVANPTEARFHHLAGLTRKPSRS